MIRRNGFFISMFLFVVLLFGLLYFIGFINYFFEDATFFANMKFLDFGSKLIAFFYLIILSIFFTLVIAIMIKLIITPNSGPVRVITKESKQSSSSSISPEVISGIIEISSKKIFAENELRLTSLMEGVLLQDRVDDIYFGISQMFADISESFSAMELFEKVLYWGTILSGSKRASVLIADKNILTIYKTSGWTAEEKSSLEKVTTNFGNRVSGRIAERKEFVVCNDIDDFTDYSFPDRKKYSSNSFISFPLLSSERTVCVFNFTNNRRSGYYSIGETEIMRVLSGLTIKTYELLMIKKRNNRTIS